MPARSATPCPRCDYDLSGARDSWTDSCPLDGRCPECGLDIRWAEVLNPELSVPKWSFEHAQGRLPRRLIETLARTLWPFGFWRALRMEHPIVRPRLIRIAACWAIVLHLGIGMGTSVGGIANAFARARGFMPMRDPFAYEIIASVIGWLVWPYSPINSRVWHHPVQGTLAIHLIFLCVVTLCPLAFLPLGDSLRTARVRRAHLWRVAAYSAAPIALAIVCIGLLNLAFACESNNLAVFPGFGPFSTYDELASIAIALTVLATPPWLLLFWWAACRRYLRLPHAFGVALAVVTISVLAVGTAFMLYMTSRYRY